VIVPDASIVAPALIDAGADGERARAALAGADLVAPALLDLEVTSVLRRLVAAGSLEVVRAGQAMADLVDLPVERVTHEGLVARCWELSHNLTPYDAAYVALAEALDGTLVTADARLEAAPGPRCRIDLIER